MTTEIQGEEVKDKDGQVNTEVESKCIAPGNIMTEGLNHSVFLYSVTGADTPEMILGILPEQTSRWVLEKTNSRLDKFLMSGRLRIKNGVMVLTHHCSENDFPSRSANIIKRIIPLMQASGLYGKANLITMSGYTENCLGFEVPSIT